MKNAKSGYSTEVDEDSSPAVRWFALNVRSRDQFFIADFLVRKGYECFLPVSHRTDRSRNSPPRSGVPLFPGYLFCRFDVTKRLPILMTPGVIGVVSRGKIPIPVEDVEIFSMQKAIHRHLNVQPWPSIPPGHPVEIMEGPLAGLTGVFVKLENKQRLFLTVILLQRSVLVEVNDTACAIPDKATLKARKSIYRPGGLKRVTVAQKEPRSQFHEPHHSRVLRTILRKVDHRCI